MTFQDDLLLAERHIIAGRFTEAARICLSYLGSFEGKNKYFSTKNKYIDVIGDMTLFAGVITRLLANPAYKPSNNEVHQFLLYKRVIAQVFEISGYRGTGHFSRLIGELDEQDNWKLSPAETCRLLMAVSINASPDKIIDILKSCNPRLMLLTAIAFISEQFTWSEQAESVRTELLKGDILQGDVALQNMEFKLLASAWMGCSYSDAPHKHVIKDKLNEVVRNWLRNRGVQDTQVDRNKANIENKPKVLIIAELYYKDHAMDRCYGPDFRSLRKHFHTTLMMAAGKHDPAIVEEFDEVDPIEFDLAAPEKFIEQAQAHNADFVYLPSVGMRIGGIACANTRIAPVQIATLGHPATTRSSCIDYIIMPEEILGEQECFTETLLFRPEGHHFVARSDAKPIGPNIRKQPEKIRLAVPAWVRKLSPKFLTACKEIAAKASRPVEFWFFPNVRGALHQAMKRRLENILPARVFASTDYNRYIANINECDIHLSTFPFGATNGIIDSAQQGLPVVNMDGAETHSRIDGFLVERLQQPEWLTAADVDKYVDAVVRLVDDNALRTDISESILNGQPDRQFLMEGEGVNDDFVKILLGLLRHHEDLQASKKKVWHYNEMLAFADDDLQSSQM